MKKTVNHELKPHQNFVHSDESESPPMRDKYDE